MQVNQSADETAALSTQLLRRGILNDKFQTTRNRPCRTSCTACDFGQGPSDCRGRTILEHETASKAIMMGATEMHTQPRMLLICWYSSLSLVSNSLISLMLFSGGEGGAGQVGLEPYLESQGLVSETQILSGHKASQKNVDALTHTGGQRYHPVRSCKISREARDNLARSRSWRGWTWQG